MSIGELERDGPRAQLIYSILKFILILINFRINFYMKKLNLKIKIIKH